MPTSGAGIWFPLGNKSVHDYQHASLLFRSNDFDRAPKSKYLFYVTININPNALSDQFTSPPSPVGPNELNYLVKTIDMPRFEMEVQPLNQYNRVVHAQRTIRYNPITIKFHDDTIGSLRHFWASYYNYYVADGSYTDLDFTIDDKYQPRDLSRWGLDTGTLEPYLQSIEIYSLARATGSKITLQNPIITNFSHDTHDYSEGQGVLEANMTVRYSAVTYEDGIDAVYGIPGFGLAAQGTYDTTPSPISSGIPGLQVNFSTGQVYDTASVVQPTQKISYTNNTALGVQTVAYQSNSLKAAAAISNNQINSVLQNTYTLPTNSGYVFPTAQTANYAVTDFGAVPVSNSVTSSDGNVINSPADLNILYPANSWQQSLFEKGYTAEQITAANQYISNQISSTTNPPDNLEQVAMQYLTNPNALSIPSNYGQTTPQNVLISSGNSTQAIYNGQTLEENLKNLGYSADNIQSAVQYLSQIKLAPGADSTAIAQNYLNQGGGVIPTLPVSSSYNTL